MNTTSRILPTPIPADDTATGARAVPSSQRLRTRSSDQSSCTCPSGFNVLRTGDGSRSVINGLFRSLAAVASCAVLVPSGVCALAAPKEADSSQPAKAIAKAVKPRLEVCFVIDTTGSMGGLIEGAKQKIWSIANDMIRAKPTPEIRLGLVAYRDRRDEYVTRTFDLTNDIDAIYGHLRSFQAAGGGDEPESVNEALQDAVRKMSWSQDRAVLKLIFLVGDAPPHMDYADGPKYPQVCQEAVKNDIIINTVQCGSIERTTPFWKEIAQLSEGGNREEAKGACRNPGPDSKTVP